MKPRSLRSLGPVKSSTFFLRRQNGDHDFHAASWLQVLQNPDAKPSAAASTGGAHIYPVPASLKGYQYILKFILITYFFCGLSF